MPVWFIRWAETTCILRRFFFFIDKKVKFSQCYLLSNITVDDERRSFTALLVSIIHLSLDGGVTWKLTARNTCMKTCCEGFLQLNVITLCYHIILMTNTAKSSILWHFYLSIQHVAQSRFCLHSVILTFHCMNSLYIPTHRRYYC